VPSDYRVSPALAARMLGVFLGVLGVVVLGLTLAVAVLSLPTGVLTGGVLVAVAAVLGIGFLISRRPFVVRLDDAGYQVRMVRGAGVKQARWKDVEDVVATTVSGERCVVLRLRDGRTTILPVRVLAGDSDAFVKDLQAHLDKGHGYRRIS
jgi:hypothetical protein